jgi:hypothetical protein
MVARIQPRLAIRFEREGEEPIRIEARDRRDATAAAISQLLSLRLRAGDVPRVEAADEGPVSEAIINGKQVKFRERKIALPDPRAIKTVHDKGTVQVPSVAALAAMLGWERTRTTRALPRWAATGEGRAGRAACRSAAANRARLCRIDTWATRIKP